MRPRPAAGANPLGLANDFRCALIAHNIVPPANASFEELERQFILLLHLIARRIAPVPRKVVNAIPAGKIAANAKILNEIEHRLEGGHALHDRVSRRAFGKTALCRSTKDHLYFGWGIAHLHLGHLLLPRPSLSDPYLRKGTDRTLLVHLYLGTATILAFKRHPIQMDGPLLDLLAERTPSILERWEVRGVNGLSRLNDVDGAHSSLVRGSNSMFQYRDKYYLPGNGMVSSAGTFLRFTRQLDKATAIISETAPSAVLGAGYGVRIARGSLVVYRRGDGAIVSDLGIIE